MFSKLQTKEGLMMSGSLFLLLSSILILAFLFSVPPFLRAVTGTVEKTEGNTITVTASGESYAVPDVADFSFTIREEADDVADAQVAVSEKIAPILDELEKLGIDEKDIKTQGYSSNPRYEWKRPQAVICPVGSYCPEPDRERVLLGYEVSQSINVRVRDTEKVSDVVTVLAEGKVENMYGPNFVIDDPDTVQDEAREEAIGKAKDKAKNLAKELGVRLGKIVSFSEGGSGYPMFARAEMAYDEDMAMMGATNVATPQLPVGENKVTASVTITYKIK